MEQIEVGASDADGTLRYWRAKEAIRQGEARLAAQSGVRSMMEARATAITGWAAAGLAVTAGALFAAPHGWSWFPVALTACILFAAGGIGVAAARPRDWSMSGYDPQVLIENRLQTELEVLEALAGGISAGFQANNRRLNDMALNLRIAGWMLIAAPIVGLAAYLASRLAT